MKNVMVCVTQQKTCDRLIKHGAKFLGDDEGELFVIHVAKYGFNFLGNSKEGEALEYLFEKSKEYGANLTVVRSNDVLKTLVELIEKNCITHVVLGESSEAEQKNDMVRNLVKRVKGKATIEVIPAEAE
ncbi:MAG: universal stress protein UspA [Clostridiales bacterium]|nr:universal stress protein UspA [Clostridiales bacterium]